MPLTREQLDGLSLEQLQQMKQQLEGGQPQGFGGRLKAGLQAGLKAVPAIFGHATGTKEGTVQDQLDQLKINAAQTALEKTRLDIAEKKEKAATQQVEKEATETENIRRGGFLPDVPSKIPTISSKAATFGKSLEQSFPGTTTEANIFTQQPGEAPIQANQPVVEETIPQFIESPEGPISETGKRSASVITNPAFEQQQELEQTRLEQKEERFGKLLIGRRISFNNLEKVTGGIRNGVDAYIEAVKAGQAGDSLVAARTRTGSSKYGNLPIPKLLGGGTVQSRYGEAGSAVEGTINESLFNMIPMLTQQGEKAGSVRLMQTVIDRLANSLPRLETSPGAARNMWSRTIKSFFRFARAAELSGKGFDNLYDVDTITDETLDTWIAKVKIAANRIELDEDETEALEYFISKALRPLDEFLEIRDGKAKPRIAIEELDATDIDGQLAEIDAELQRNI